MPTGASRHLPPGVCERPFLGMLASVSAATLNGAVGQPVSVEVHVSNGLPGFTIVGLPDAALRESRDRVWAALLSSGLPWPLRADHGQLSALDVSRCDIESVQPSRWICRQVRRRATKPSEIGVVWGLPRMKCPRELARGQLHPQTGAFSE